jgi:putative endonuclease
LHGVICAGTIVGVPWTYLLRCADDSYYVGSTRDLEQRVYQHNSPDQGATYTRYRQPVLLVWSEWFDRVEDAYAFEKRVQGWSRKKREALIRGDWAALPGLARRALVQRRAIEQVRDET